MIIIGPWSGFFCTVQIFRSCFQACFFKYSKAKVESIESLPSSKGLKLDSYLLIPMQRITKYPDLLKKVKKSRPSMDGIDTAIQKSEFLLTSVNSSVAVLEDASKTDWLLTHISSKSGGLPSDLNSVR